MCGARSTSFLPASTAVGIKRAPKRNSDRSRSQSRFLLAGPEITSYAAVTIASIDATSDGLASGMFDVSALTFDVGIRVAGLGIGYFLLFFKLHNPQGLTFNSCSTFIAALWPGIPLTAPPRNALDPQRNTFSYSVSTPHVPTCSLRSAKGHVGAF